LCGFYYYGIFVPGKGDICSFCIIIEAGKQKFIKTYPVNKALAPIFALNDLLFIG